VLNQAHLTELIAKSQGRKCALVVERAGRRLTFDVTPVYDEKLKRGRIGIGFANQEHYIVQRPGPTPWKQIAGDLEVWTRTVSALVHHNETGIGPSQLSGPVGIMGMLANSVRIDWRLGLSFLVMLNVNLALLNLLPLPVLDGGHIAMALYELLTRRRVSLRFQEYATTAFALVIVSFMLYVTFFDLGRLPLFKSMLQQKSVVESAEHPAEPSTVASPGPVPAK
jgi:regulator of sigma E protease